MLPEIGTTRLRMATLAGIVDVQACELRGGCFAVHVVAAGTVHLAFKERMGECLARLTALLLVAVVTDFRLSRHVLHRVACHVADVAVGARDLVARVRAVVPANANALLVTIKAHAVLGFDIAGRVRAEVRTWGPFLPAPHATRMGVARPVAGLALQLPVTERPGFVGTDRVLRLEHRQRHCIFVAGQAGISALAAVVSILAVGGGRRQDQ